MWILISKWNRFGLQLRIMAYVTIGLIVLFGGLAYFSAHAIYVAEDYIVSERTAFVQSLARDLDKDLEHLEFHLQLGAESLALPSKDFPLVGHRLYQLLNLRASGGLFRMFSLRILDGQGQLLAAVPATLWGAPLPDTRDVQLALEQNRALVLPSLVVAEGVVPFASVVMPVLADWTNGQPLAVVVDTVGVSNVSPTVPGGGTAYSVEVLGVDGLTIVSTTHPEQAGKRSLHYSILRKYVEAGRSGAEVHRLPKGALEGDHIAAVAPLASGPFYLVLEQPVDLALAVPRQRQSQMLLAISVGILLALAAAWHTTRAVVRPVRQLRAAARAIANGSLNSPVQVRAQDEVGELAEDIETMRRQLKRSKDDLEQAKLQAERKVEERTQRLHETLGKVINAQEEERRRLARELHDEQSQALGALAVSLDRLSRLLKPSTSEVTGEIEQARDMARSLLRETRRLIYDLRPSVLDDMGLEAAIRWSAETHLERHGVQVSIRSLLAPGRLPAPVETSLFRVAQEAIVNIERHAQAQHAGIVLEQRDASLRMEVSDDGRGFGPNAIGNGLETPGVGLEGMRERVRLIGGTIEIVSASGKGTQIKVEVPLD